MHIRWIRKIAALVAGIASFVGSLFYTDFAFQYLEPLLYFGGPSGAGPLPIYHKFGDGYIHFAWLGVIFATSISATMLLWSPRPTRRVALTIYWLLLAAVLPLSIANYYHADTFVPRWQQAVLDVLLAFLGSVAVGILLKLAFIEPAERVFQAIIVFLLTMNAILIPATYAILWILNAERALSLADTRSFAPSWVTATSSVGGLIVSILNYRRTPAQASPPLIVT